MSSFISPEAVATDKLDRTIEDVVAELHRAQKRFPPFHSAHEGYAVILEEEQELWDEIRLKSGTPEGRRTEAVQLAAMALRFLLDVCDG